MRKATLDDLTELSKMLFIMYNEVQPDLASSDLNKYTLLAREHLEKDFVFIDEDARSMFIVRDASIPVLEDKIYDGVSVFIHQEFRKTKLLSQMYDYMVKQFTATIIGCTDVKSQHNKVLMKRHNLVGYTYVLNRTKDNK